MNDEQMLTLVAALLLASDALQGVIWEASGDGEPRTYKYDTATDAAKKARALYATVKQGTV